MAETNITESPAPRKPVTLDEIMDSHDALSDAYFLLEKARKLRCAIKDEEKAIGPLCAYCGVEISGGSIVLHGEDWFRGEKWQDDSDHDFEEEILTNGDEWKRGMEQTITALEADHAMMLTRKARREARAKTRREKQELARLKEKYDAAEAGNG